MNIIFALHERVDIHSAVCIVGGNKFAAETGDECANLCESVGIICRSYRGNALLCQLLGSAESLILQHRRGCHAHFACLCRGDCDIHHLRDNGICARAGTGDYGYLRYIGVCRLCHHFAVARESINALENLCTCAVKNAHDRRTGFLSHIIDIANLFCVHFAECARETGIILRKCEYKNAVYSAVACDNRLKAVILAAVKLC